MPYVANTGRYENPSLHRRCGRSGLMLPAVSLGLWHNFGSKGDPAVARALILRAFDLGITHFDLANNYGPPPGAAEISFGRILREDLAVWRNELIISTKAGHAMWQGPYGEWGSRKHIIASLDQSLRRMGVDHVDIFYSHRPDLRTPLEETMAALSDAVKSGRALYAGISNYDAASTADAARLLRSYRTPCLIHQARYNLFNRRFEADLARTLVEEGIGGIAFSPLAQGLLTNRYLEGIPPDARAVRDPRFLKPSHLTAGRISAVRELERLARSRGQTLAQMALAWVLRNPAVTSVLVGASTPAQIEDNLGCVRSPSFSDAELGAVDRICGNQDATGQTPAADTR